MDPDDGRCRLEDGRAFVLPAARRGGILGPLGYPPRRPHPGPAALLLDRVAQATARRSARILVQALHAVPGRALRASPARAREPGDHRRLPLAARAPPVAGYHTGTRPA